jgi:16S rRNA G1207 methylase RsmC
MFPVAIPGRAPTSVPAAAQDANAPQNSANANPPIDPAKEADIRALLELVGERDQGHDSVRQSAEQYRERRLATSNEQGQVFVNTAINESEEKKDVARRQQTAQRAALYVMSVIRKLAALRRRNRNTARHLRMRRSNPRHDRPIVLQQRYGSRLLNTTSIPNVPF